MCQIDLREYEPTKCTLSVAQRDALLREKATLGLSSIEPIPGSGDVYQLTARSKVGAVEIGDLSVLIEPKIGIPQLLSLACYAMGVVKSQEDKLFDFEEKKTLPDTLALALAAAARRAFSQGLLHGYRMEEEALHTVRGRIRFTEQIRRRFGSALPIEVRYDEFTADILANQLVKAAARRLGRMPLRSHAARRDLGLVAGMLEQVSPVEFPSSAVPELRFDRLNEHYRGVVGLSRLILRHSAFESGRGDVRASGFLLDMNTLFQEFVTVALRERLRVSDRTLRSDGRGPEFSLDEQGSIGIEPDLSWWDDGICTFVGDAKYKDETDAQIPNADLYQLLAYATALDLPGGLLIYAEGAADGTSYQVRGSGKRLEVATLNLSGALSEVLDRVDGLAVLVQRLRDEAQGIRCAA